MSSTPEQPEAVRQAEETLVEVEDLRKYYGGSGVFARSPVKAVDGVSFTIKRGETLGLVGESGCGKSTLGRTLIRLEEATEGVISFDGTDITTLSGEDLKTWRRNAQMVFQDPESSLNDRMTVGEIIREPLDAHGWGTKRERQNRALDLLTSVGLREEHYYRYPHQFSGGQRQRVGIARALALEPEFIVLDEPVSALDVSVQAKIITLLEDLQEEFDLTYLFIAHDLSVVRHICDRVAVMYLGKIMELGETEELYENARNPYTRSLLSAIPHPEPGADPDRITLPGTPPSPRDPPTGCQFSTRCPAKIRPEGLDTASRRAIESIRDAIRDRTDVELSEVDRLRRRLGVFSEFDNIEGDVADALEGVVPPTKVDSRIEEAVEHVTAGYPAKGLELLEEDFDSDAYAPPTMDDEVWDAIERFREVIRERSRMSLGTVDRVKRSMGRFSAYDDIDETVADLFGDLDTPADVREHVETATELVKEGRPEEAREYLRTEFNSVCDLERPETYAVGATGHTSYCHRHGSEYEDVVAVLDERTSDS